MNPARKISILCSDEQHPIQRHLREWIERLPNGFQAELVSKTSDLAGGDLLFLISCHERIKKPVRDRYLKSLVVHASDLPEGRGWSPHIWSIVEGARFLVVTLFEAADDIDTGPIWKKQRFKLEGHELYDEINAKLFETTLDLMGYAIENFATVTPIEQPPVSGETFRRRTPDDSRIDPHRTIGEQFNLLRVADPDRYPAFFELNGYRYEIMIRKRRN